MPRWTGALVTALLLCLASGAASAREKAEPAPCGAGNSQRVTIAALWSSERRLHGRCAAIEGYRVGDVIFTDQRALYDYMAAGSSLPKHVVGIAWPNRVDRDGAGLWRGTYYGRIESCRETRRSYARTQRNLARRRDDGEIILVHLYGFCASSAGPALRVDAAEAAPASDLQRLTDTALRDALGELRPVGADYAYPALLPWLTGLATGGCDADFKAGPPPAGPAEGMGAGFYPPRLDPAQAEQLARWCASSRRETALFSISGPTEQGTKLNLLVCLCTVPDCAGRWPVALLDTGWGQVRPYMCQRAVLRPGRISYGEGQAPEYSKYSYEFKDEWIVDGPWQEWGFKEPDD